MDKCYKDRMTLTNVVIALDQIRGEIEKLNKVPAPIPVINSWDWCMAEFPNGKHPPTLMPEQDFLIVTTKSGGIWQVLFIEDYDEVIAHISQYAQNIQSTCIHVKGYRVHSVFDIQTGKRWDSINRIWEKMT